MKIAILDDDQRIRTTVALLLEALGHAPEAFATEEELFNRLEDFDPDIVILDQMLGGKRTGIQLVPELRSEHPGLPIIIVSGYPQVELQEAIELNQVGFLPKPFSVAKLENQISACFAQQGH